MRDSRTVDLGGASERPGTEAAPTGVHPRGWVQATVRHCAVAPLAVWVLLASAALAEPTTGTYLEEVRAWQARRLASLRDPEGWVALAGLLLLRDGNSGLGAAPDNELRFPQSAPAHIGRLSAGPGTLHLDVEPGVDVRAVEGGVTAIELRTDAASEGPTKLRVGALSWWVIERAGRRWLRLCDADHPALADPMPIEFYPIDPVWRVPAQLHTEARPQVLSVPTVLGLSLDEVCAGTLEFAIDGHPCRLRALAGEDGDLFVIFADATNGGATYGGGRFLLATAPDAAGQTFLDFNRAYNPPCAFTSFATCPLPPAGNRLGVAVTAGEKAWAGGAH